MADIRLRTRIHGSDIALGCDLRIAEETCVFSLPEAKMGIPAVALVSSSRQRGCEMLPVSVQKHVGVGGVPCGKVAHLGHAHHGFLQ